MADFTKNANATLNLVQLLISGTTCRPNCWPATISARQRHRHGEPDPSRYRLFPACLGSICCEPFEGEVSDKTNAGPQCRCSPTPLQCGGQEPP
jgi:hypothetical protein